MKPLAGRETLKLKLSTVIKLSPEEQSISQKKLKEALKRFINSKRRSANILSLR
jgi:hypothetical protein